MDKVSEACRMIEMACVTIKKELLERADVLELGQLEDQWISMGLIKSIEYATDEIQMISEEIVDDDE